MLFVWVAARFNSLKSHDICVLLDLPPQAGIHHMGIGDDAADVIEVVRGNFLPHLSDEDGSNALKEIVVALSEPSCSVSLPWCGFVSTN